jgi:hypothetical protein
MLPTAATAIAAALPRIYSTVVQHGEAFTNVFAVRPRAIVVDSADGGELRIRWTHWSPTSASGYGRAYPDHGSFAITVRVADVIEGEFTRLTVVAKRAGRTYPPNRLELGTDGTTLTWARVNWVGNPESGLSPWPG